MHIIYITYLSVQKKVTFILKDSHICMYIIKFTNSFYYYVKCLLDSQQQKAITNVLFNIIYKIYFLSWHRILSSSSNMQLIDDWSIIISLLTPVFTGLAWPHSSRYRWPAQCNGGHTPGWPSADPRRRNYSAPSARKLAPAIAAPRQVNSSVLWWVLMIMCGHLPSLARVWGGKGSNEFRGGFHIIRRRLLLVLYRCCKNLSDTVNGHLNMVHQILA